MKKLRKSKINRKSNRKSLKTRRKTRNQKRNKKTLSRRKSRRIQKRKNKINKKSGGNEKEPLLDFVKILTKEKNPTNCRGKSIYNQRLIKYVKNILQFNRQQKFDLAANYNNINKFYKVDQSTPTFFEKYTFQTPKNNKFKFWQLFENDSDKKDIKKLFDFIVNYSFLYNIKKFFVLNNNEPSERSIQTYIYVTRKHPNSNKKINSREISFFLNKFSIPYSNYEELDRQFQKYFDHLDKFYKYFNLEKLSTKNTHLETVDKILIMIKNKIKNFVDENELIQKYYDSYNEYEENRKNIGRIDNDINKLKEQLSATKIFWKKNPINSQIEVKEKDRKGAEVKFNESYENLNKIIEEIREKIIFDSKEEKLIENLTTIFNMLKDEEKEINDLIEETKKNLDVLNINPNESITEVDKKAYLDLYQIIKKEDIKNKIKEIILQGIIKRTIFSY